jgi:hypothetical protein
LLVAALLAISACGGDASEEFQEAREMRSRFRTLVGPSYACDYQNLFFLTGPIVEPVRMTVRGGQIASLVSLRTGEPIPPDLWSHFLTVEGLFAAIEEAALGGADEVRVRYDERYGYPADVLIDPDANTIDEERRYAVANLQPES